MWEDRAPFQYIYKGVMLCYIIFTLSSFFIDIVVSHNVVNTIICLIKLLVIFQTLLL